MSQTLPGILSIGSLQLSTYVGAWTNLRLHQVDCDPLNPDPTSVDYVGRGGQNSLRFRLANTYLRRGYRHERALFEALGVDRDDLTTALKGGIPFRAWFQEHRRSLPWMSEYRDRGRLVVDELFQLHLSLEQTAHRTDLWHKGNFRYLPSGTEQHFVWLRSLLSTRVRLAQHAVSHPELQGIEIYFDARNRTEFGLLGVDQSLRQFFHIKTPLPLPESA